ERHIWPFLRTIEGRVSAEQILCGRGLENLHRAMVLEQRNRPPSELASALDFELRDHEITAAALNDSDGLAAEAVDLFCTILGRVAGDLALTGLTHGGVYLAGGIVQKIEPLLHASGFRSAFEDKAPHGALMSQIAVSLIRHPLPALLGLAKLAQQPELFLVDLEHRSWKSRAG
ncbi:MAG: glucokinase, partial [Pseudomonadota bacterium]